MMLFLAGSILRAAIVGDCGTMAIAPIAQLAELYALEDATICTVDFGLLSAVVEAYTEAGQLDSLDVALRGQGLQGAPVPLSVRRTGWPVRWLDISGQYPDSDPHSTANGLGLGSAPVDAEAAAGWLQELHSQWLPLAEAAIGDRLGVTLASTAARIAIPAAWKTAHRAAAARRPRKDGFDLSGWNVAQLGYYGGRVFLAEHARDYRGEAVEYDLRSAYGWALCQRLPDWKTYDRKPWPSQPAWYDVTVRFDGRIGQLPVRHPEHRAALLYPAGGETARGVWTREDLDRATSSGATVLEQHGVMSGRWSHDLQPAVASWLDAREKAQLAPVKALFRFLSNSLAGKLCQRSQGWRLWDARDGHPPAGAVLLGAGGWTWAYPAPANYQSVTCPQAGSYVTAYVRSRVWPELQRPEALYSDTDSIHLPASAAPPADLGSAPGQWVEKARGAARYNGPKNYTVGTKRASGPCRFRAPAA